MVAALLLAGAACWGLGSALTRSTHTAVEAPAAPARRLSIASTDGMKLAGSFWPAPMTGAPAILMLHGNGSNRGSIARMAAWLNSQGYAVLAIDFREHGESSPADKSFGLHEADDAWAALDWLRRTNPGARIGVIGFSLGGAASLLGVRGPLQVDALVLEGVYPDIRHAIFNRLATRLGRWPAALIEPALSYQSMPRFGVWPSAISPLHALGQVKEPVLIVGGGADANTPPNETRAMFEAVRSHGELQILAGISHNGLGGTMSAPFKASLLSFLDRNLKPADHWPD